MGKATLVIMAAGIGSRFGGGIKQLEPVGPNGEIIMDYSVYDAVCAGFDKVVFVIRKDLEKDFRAVIGDRIAQHVEVAYAFQEITDIPEQFQNRYADRTKPWGTGQAILCCKEMVSEPFLVINADDYYGKEAYREAFSYLNAHTDCENRLPIGMVGFVLGNTLSENGGVTRGLCRVDENHMLTDIVETKNILKTPEGASVDGQAVDMMTPVSMNMWAFRPEFFEVLENGFSEFLEGLGTEYQKEEYLLPTIVGNLLKEGMADIKVLTSHDRWFGVTYREDKEAVVTAVRSLIEQGIYPQRLFERQ